MEIKIPHAVASMMLKKGSKCSALSETSFGDSVVDVRFLDEKDLKLIEDLAPKNGQGVTLLRKVKQVRVAREDGQRFVQLEPFSEAMRAFFDALPLHRFYVMSGDNMLPYLVTALEYHPPERRRDYHQPAFVSMNGTALRRGNHVGTRINVYREDLKDGMTVAGILAGKGIFPETAELNEEYALELESYHKRRVRTGNQFYGTGSGMAFTKSPWRMDREREEDLVDPNGDPVKLLMDDEEDQGDEATAVSIDIFTSSKDFEMVEEVDREEDEDGDPVPVKVLRGKRRESLRDEEEMANSRAYPLPVHPFFRMFRLDSHEFVTVHLNSTQPYRYDRELADKLVLDPTHKSMVDLLLNIKGKGDVVRGKARGTIILASGAPGTGKTMTAESYSEYRERPLYQVQCSQLGVSPEDLETRLGEILIRATRWNVILQIDEADVYIRTRGDDIQQNAIVGVFLRLLEYYHGVLFLTTNRETEVDDAILSRLTAHVRYRLPNEGQRAAIWDIQLKNVGISAEGSKALSALAKLGPFSGRTIRNLSRLARTVLEASGVEFPEPGTRTELLKTIKEARLVEAVQSVIPFQDVEKA